MTPIRRRIRAAAPRLGRPARGRARRTAAVVADRGGRPCAESFTVPADRSFTIDRPRLRARPRDVAVRRARAPRARAHAPADPGFYYPGTTLAKTTGWLRVLITAHTASDVVVLAQPGLVAARPGRPARTTRCPATSAPPAGGCRVSTAPDRRRLQDRRLAPLPAGRAGRAHRRRRVPGTVGHAHPGEASGNRAYRGRLSASRRSPAPRQPGHRQLRDARRLRQGRGPGRDAGVVEPRGGAGPGGRRAHLRRLVARRSTPTATTRSATPPPARSTAATAPRTPRQRRRRRDRGQILTYGGEPAFTQFSVEQRRLDLGRRRRPTCRQGRPVRRLDRQPGPRLERQGQRRRGSRGATRRSAP